MSFPSVLKPVLYCGLPLGLVPYSPRHRSLHLPSALYSLAVAFLVVQSFLRVLSSVLAEDSTELYSYGFLLPLQTSLNSLVTVTSVLAVLYKYPLWLRLLRGFASAEVTLRPSHTSAIVLQVAGILATVLFVCAYFLAFYRSAVPRLGLLLVFGQSLSTTINSLLMVEFLTYVLMLKAGFRSVNCALDAGGSVRSAREAHHRLSVLCEVSRTAFGPQLLASVAKAILLITVILYSVSLTVIGKADPGRRPVVYLSVLGVVLTQNSIELLMVVFLCASASDQANYTAVLVHKLLNKRLPAVTTDELQLFSYQLLHQKVSFSVCGFFNLDFTLLNGVIASVATYLVILIQFQM